MMHSCVKMKMVWWEEGEVKVDKSSPGIPTEENREGIAINILVVCFNW